MQRTILLASQSPYRRALLDQMGLPYLAENPPYEEDHALPMPPAELVVYLACGKALSLADTHPDALILGSDQMAIIDGDILTKPGNKERAIAQLMRLSGRTHQLLTAVALHDPRTGETSHELVTYEMVMRTLTPELAANYIDRDQPLDCAGSYKIESTGMALFEEVRGPDHTAIIGLPLTSVCRLLAKAGVDALELCVHSN